MTANFACFLIVLPSRTSDVAAHDTLNRKHFGFPDEHRSAAQLVRVVLHPRRHLIDSGRNQMMRSDMSELSKPELRKRGEHFTFTFDRCRNYAVESRNSISRNDQQTVFVDLINVSDFTAF